MNFDVKKHHQQAARMLYDKAIAQPNHKHANIWRRWMYYHLVRGAW